MAVDVAYTHSGHVDVAARVRERHLATGLPLGTYTFALFTTARNAFADGVNGPGDITAFATDQLQSL